MSLYKSKILMKISMITSLGSIYFELYPNKAPITVENFISYIDSKFFEGLIFHRVIDNFMIQSGSWDPEMNFNDPGPNILNESTNGLLNLRGTIGMARNTEPHSANSQFYINQVDNPHSDFKDSSNPGYCVFGKVISGMDVVDTIAKVEVIDRDISGTFLESVPIEPVIIKKIHKVFVSY